MSIYAGLFSNTDTTYSEQVLNDQAEIIARHAIMGAAAVIPKLVQEVNERFEAVWENPRIPVTKIVEKMGTRARDCFRGHALVCEFLLTKFPESGAHLALKFPPSDVDIVYEVVDGVETGRVLITPKA